MAEKRSSWTRAAEIASVGGALLALLGFFGFQSIRSFSDDDSKGLDASPASTRNSDAKSSSATPPPPSSSGTNLYVGIVAAGKVDRELIKMPDPGQFAFGDVTWSVDGRLLDDDCRITGHISTTSGRTVKTFSGETCFGRTLFWVEPGSYVAQVTDELSQMTGELRFRVER